MAISHEKQLHKAILSIMDEARKKHRHGPLQVREDIAIAERIIHGEFPGIEISKANDSINNPLAFSIGNTRIWRIYAGWVVADIEDGHYTNHRTYSTSLEINLLTVIAEKEAADAV